MDNQFVCSCGCELFYYFYNITRCSICLTEYTYAGTFFIMREYVNGKYSVWHTEEVD